MTGRNGKPITAVALYARVSTLDKGQDPEMQLRELRAHAQAQGWTIHREYVDHGISGSKDSRPQLNRLMLDAQAQQFDAVLVWKLDRFSRSLRMLITSLDQLAGAGVSFVSLRDNLDLTTASGQLMFHVIGAFAQFERSIIRERVQAGLDRRKSELQTRGYFISKKGNRRERLGRKARTDIDVQEIVRLRGEGLDWREIAERTGVPRSTCYRVCPKNLRKAA
jgi:putative DNA-invertase from lambdoid prophage Rac